MEFFCSPRRHCSAASVPAGCPFQEKKKNTLLRLPGVLACWACCGQRALLGLWACWLAGLRAFFSFFFFFFSFAGCLLPAFFLFLFSTIFLFLFVVQIFICTLKHNIKFRLNKINIIYIK